MKLRITKVLTTVAATALALSFTLPAAAAELGNDKQADPALTQRIKSDEASGSGNVTFTRGHFDLAPRVRDGKLVFLGRDDAGEQPLWRNLDDVVFRLDQTALQTVPEGPDYAFTGAAGKQVYTVPQTEVQGVPWLGWSTQAPDYLAAAPEPTVLTFEGHQGPGRFTAFVQAGNFGKPQLLWDSTREQAQKISIEPNTHAHLNWVFTEPGVHLVRVAVSAKLDGKAATQSAVIRFAIGEQASAEAALAAQWTQNQATPTRGAEVAEAEASNQNLPLMIGGGMLGAGLVLALVAVLIMRRDRARRAAALASASGNEAANG